MKAQQKVCGSKRWDSFAEAANVVQTSARATKFKRGGRGSEPAGSHVEYKTTLVVASNSTSGVPYCILAFRFRVLHEDNDIASPLRPSATTSI